MTSKATKSTKPHGPSKTIYLIAGEESGDQIGGSLLKSLKRHASSPIRIEGIGGRAMQNEGLNSLFPMAELSVMGLFEILPHALNIYARLNQTIEDIKRIKPDVIVTVDAPGFNFRLAKRIKSLNIPVVHINAPTVWAWKPRRAEKVAGYLTHLLTLFPFEPPYFLKHGLSTTFMGHPLVEKKLDKIPEAKYRKSHKIKDKQPLLCLLPGSRDAEVKTHLPIFLDAVEILKLQFPDLEVVIPTLEKFKDQITADLKQRGISGFVISDEAEKYEAMRASTVALAASGTVTLELGLCDTPMVVAYKTNALTAKIVEKMLLTKHVSLANILLENEVVPELLQDACSPEVLSLKLHKLLIKDSETHETQKKELKKLIPLIKADPNKLPSDIAAETIISYAYK